MAEQPTPQRIVFVRGQLFVEAANYVRELIISGQLQPGQRVKPEFVAERLDISTTPAREALHALVGEGFLRLEPRRGFSVARLTGADIRDVFRANSLLAGELAARAAERITPDSLEVLQQIQAQIIAARDDAEQVETLNHAFHREVNLLADAPKIAIVLRTLSKYAPRQFFGTIHGWPAATIHDHGDLLTALAAKDAEAARAAMAAHIEHAGDLLADSLDARLASITAAE